MSLIRVLQSELRSLSSEAKRKYPNVREAAEHSLQIVTHLSSTLPQNASNANNNIKQSKQIQGNEDVIKPFLMACETKQTKLSVIALSALQQLLLHSAIPLGGLNIVVETIARLIDQTSTNAPSISVTGGSSGGSGGTGTSGSNSSSSGSPITVEQEQVQLKILQLALTILTSNEYELNQTTLSKLLSICFRLHGSKSTNVHHTAIAVIQQATTLLFEQLDAQHKLVNNMQLSSSGTNVKDSEEKDEQIEIEKKKLFSNMKIAYMFLQDMCLFAEYGNYSGTASANVISSTQVNMLGGKWLRVPGGISQGLVFQLMENITGQYSGLLQQFPEILELYKSQICQIIMKYLMTFTSNQKVENVPNGPSVDVLTFSTMLNLYRLCSIMIKRFSALLIDECAMIVNLLGSNVEQRSSVKLQIPMWSKILALEVLRATICSSADLLRLYFLNQQNTISKVISSIGGCVQSILLNEMNPSTTPQQIGFQHVPHNHKRLDVLSQEDSFNTNAEECLGVSIDCLLGLVSCMSSLAGISEPQQKRHNVSTSGKKKQNHTDMSGEKDEQLESKRLLENRKICSRIVETSWCAILATLSSLLDRCEEEETIQTILRIYLLFTHTCGVTGSATARDAFLTSLCKYAPSLSDTPTTVSTQQNSSNLSAANLTTPDEEALQNILSQVTKKNLLVLKILFHVAHCLGGLLGSSWYMLLKKFQELNHMLLMFYKKGTSSAKSAMTIPYSSSDLGDDTSLYFDSSEKQQDLKVLFITLRTLFEKSTQMNTEDLLVLLKSLIQLSKTSLSNCTANNQMPKLFGSQKVIETCLLNSDRIDEIWDIVHGHLIYLLKHCNPLVRKFVLEQILSNILLALVHPEHNPYNFQKLNISISETFEEKLFSIMDEIFQMNEKKPKSIILQDNATKEWTLTLIHSLVSKTGQNLRTGWKFILPVLQQVAQNDNASLISNAFGIIKCISDEEYVEGIYKMNYLPMYMECVGCFARQHTVQETNLSLIAIGFFWSLSDFLSTKREAQSNLHTPNQSMKNGEKSDSDADNKGNENGDQQDNKNWLEIWLTLFRELKKIIIDDRPEVRNSALRTLNFVLGSHGKAIKEFGQGWNRCIKEILVPMLNNVHDHATIAETESDPKKVSDKTLNNSSNSNTKKNNTTHEKETMESSAVDKKKTQLMVHHSRNTAAKQWSETRCLVIEGVTRLCSEHFHESLKKEPLFWSQFLPAMMGYFVQSVHTKTSEIANIASKSLFELLEKVQVKSYEKIITPTGVVLLIEEIQSTLKEVLWEGCWAVWEELVKSASLREKYLEQNTMCNLLTNINELYKKECKTTDSANIFSDQKDVERLLDLVSIIITSPLAMNVVSLPSNLHKACLSLMQQLASHSEQSCSYVFKKMECLLPSPPFIENLLESNGSDSPRSSLNSSIIPLLSTAAASAASVTTPKLSPSSPLTPLSSTSAIDLITESLLPHVDVAVPVLNIIVEACCLEAPVTVRQNLFEGFVRVLSASMMTKYVDVNYKLWKVAVQKFIIVVRTVLTSNPEAKFGATVWNQLCIAIEDFLFTTSSSPTTPAISSSASAATTATTKILSSSFMSIRTNDAMQMKSITGSKSTTNSAISEDDSEFAIVQLVENVCLTRCYGLEDDSIRKRLLTILERATKMTSHPVSQEALRCLFRLVTSTTERLDALGEESTDPSEGDDQHQHHKEETRKNLVEVSKLVIPILFRRCKTVLRQFLNEDQRTGRCPLPRYRREEVFNVLSLLRKTDVHPSLFEYLVKEEKLLQKKDTPKDSTSVSLNGRKGLIVRLFPILIEFIRYGSRDDNMKMNSLLLDMFRIVSSELGLVNDDLPESEEEEQT